MNFAEMAKIESNLKFTENGALASSSLNFGALLDLFGVAGALRNRSDSDIMEKFYNAFSENPELTIKLIFYIGNIRGGLGERRVFRLGLRFLAQYAPSIVIANFKNIAFYNRYDSILTLVDTYIGNQAMDFLISQLLEDYDALRNYKLHGAKPNISLVAKWLPSENASSKKTRALAHKIRKHADLSSAVYRKLLSLLRAYLNVVEVKMSAKEWAEIDYELVPAYAMKKYRKAFDNHDNFNYQNYLGRVEKGEAKINASTLYPYDLVHTYIENHWKNRVIDRTVEAQWKALPDYVNGDMNVMVMADVSGSMLGRPMETSIGLATYFAQHNKGIFHNLYMTFSSTPHFVSLDGQDSLFSCVNYAMGKDVGYSTDLEKAFTYLLHFAVKNDVPQSELPAALVVISDMEINSYSNSERGEYNFVDSMKTKYEKMGYKMPTLIMWNVDARHDTFLGTSNNCFYVSGQSASQFGMLCNAVEGKTAYEFMLDVLNDPMYDRVITK